MRLAPTSIAVGGACDSESGTRSSGDNGQPTPADDSGKQVWGALRSPEGAGIEVGGSRRMPPRVCALCYKAFAAIAPPFVYPFR